MSRDCKALGHVTVGDDPECGSCEALITTADRVGLHLERTGGELINPADRASVAEWGPVSLGDYVDTLNTTPLQPPAAA